METKVNLSSLRRVLSNRSTLLVWVDGVVSCAIAATSVQQINKQ